MSGDRVRWNHSRLGTHDQGWAGPGIARVLQIDPSRAGFGERGRKGVPPGPAVLIELEHNGVKQWLRASEVEPLEDAS